MTRADGDLLVPTIQRSILIIIFKEESFEFTTKTNSRECTMIHHATQSNYSKNAYQWHIGDHLTAKVLQVFDPVGDTMQL